MANFWGGCTPPRHSGTWVGARVASLRCHYPPPRRSQYSRNAEDRPHQSKTSCRGGHRRGTTTSGPGRGPLAGFAVTFYGRFSGDRRGARDVARAVFGDAPPAVASRLPPLTTSRPPLAAQTILPEERHPGSVRVADLTGQSLPISR